MSILDITNRFTRTAVWRSHRNFAEGYDDCNDSESIYNISYTYYLYCYDQYDCNEYDDYYDCYDYYE